MSGDPSEHYGGVPLPRDEHPDQRFERFQQAEAAREVRELQEERAARHTPVVLDDSLPMGTVVGQTHPVAAVERYERRIKAVEAVLRRRLPGWRDASLRRLAEECYAAADTGT